MRLHKFWKRMALDNCLWSSERILPPKQMGRLEVDTVTTLQAQLYELIKQLSNFTHKNNSAPTSDNCIFWVTLIMNLVLVMHV